MPFILIGIALLTGLAGSTFGPILCIVGLGVAILISEKRSLERSREAREADEAAERLRHEE